MAEDVNFPLDQTRNTSAFQGLREALQESGRPRRIEDQEEDLNNPDRAREGQEQQSVNEAGSLESRVELSQEAREQADPQNPTDRQNQEAQQDIAEAERRELQTNRQEVSEDAVAVEQENPSRPLDGPPSIREVSEEGAGPQGRERLEEDITSDLPSPDESARAELQGNKVAASDARILERLNEERTAEEADAIRNEPALDTPEPIETPEEPLQEALHINPLRGPRPSELRDDSDASAVETERGQNISNLI
jgi:hypothetical protein